MLAMRRSVLGEKCSVFRVSRDWMSEFAKPQIGQMHGIRGSSGDLKFRDGTNRLSNYMV